MEFGKKSQIHGISKYLSGKNNEKKFALRAFHEVLTRCLGNYNGFNLYHNRWITLCGCKWMQRGHIQNTVRCSIMLKLDIVVEHDHGKMMQESWKIMEKSWNLIPLARLLARCIRALFSMKKTKVKTFFPNATLKPLVYLVLITLVCLG